MQPKIAHLTVGGRPLCARGFHHACLMVKHNVTCGHQSIAAARRAKKVLQPHLTETVRVVPGSCPDSLPGPT